MKFTDPIVQDVLYAERLRSERRELSPIAMAKKFDLKREGETDEQAGKRYSNIVYGKSQHEDQALMMECHDERKRLLAELADYSDDAIAKRHRVRVTRPKVIRKWIAEGRFDTDGEQAA